MSLTLRRFTYVPYLLLSLTAHAEKHDKGAPVFWDLYSKAQSAIEVFLPNASLVFVTGIRSLTHHCHQSIDWTFTFQAKATLFHPAAGGFVEYAVDGSHDCEPEARTVIDTHMAKQWGFSPLAERDDFDSIQLDWPDVQDRIQLKFKDFVWANTFQILSPLVPTLVDHIYYSVPGMIGERAIRIFVDAATGGVENLEMISTK